MQISAAVYRGLARAILNSARAFERRNLADAESVAEPLARRAIALDSDDAEARVCLASVVHGHADFDGSMAEAKRALAMSPNLASAHGGLGAALMFSGRPKEGLPFLETCIRRDPHDPQVAVRLHQIALAYYLCREYVAAAEAASERYAPIPTIRPPADGSPPPLGKWGKQPKRRRRYRRLLRSRRRPPACTCAGGCHGCGPKTTLTCSKACARPGCRRSEAVPPPRLDRHSQTPRRVEPIGARPGWPPAPLSGFSGPFRRGFGQVSAGAESRTFPSPGRPNAL
jgi:hypothetical protein